LTPTSRLKRCIGVATESTFAGDWCGEVIVRADDARQGQSALVRGRSLLDVVDNQDWVGALGLF
jgi:hypothetical protein